MKKTQEELRRQNDRLKEVEAELDAICQIAPVLMFVVNADRRIVKLNRATLEFSGRSETAALGHRAGELFQCVNTAVDSCGSGVTCDSCPINNSLLDALENGVACQGKPVALLRATEQGTCLCHLMLSATPLEGGPLHRALVCITDVTDYVQEQELRQESETLYRTLIEKGFDGIFIYRRCRYQVVYLNQQMADLVGYEPAELLGKSALQLVSPESLPRVLDYIAADDDDIYEVNFKRRDGTIFPGESFGVECRFQGAAARIVAVRDISARKKTADQLRSSEQRNKHLSRQFGALLDAISDPIALLGTEMQLLWTNRAYRLLKKKLGSHEDGLMFLQFFDEKRNPLQRCLETGKLAEEQLTTPDGRIWQIRAYPLLEEDSESQQVILICVDISGKQRLLEESMRSSRMVSLGVMAAGVVHEINSPNALILYNSDILLPVFQDLLTFLKQHLCGSKDILFGGLSAADLGHEVPGLLVAIHEGAKRIKRIVNGLRDFSHHEDKEGFQLTDINKVARTAIRLVDNTIRQSTDCFTLELAEDLPLLKADAGRLEQVIINLLLNACQALDNSRQAIQLKTSYHPGAARIVLQVIDQGRGIAPEVLNSVTEPFMTTKRDRRGTGLGLSVSDHIVREHGGWLSFESQPGAGTCVSLMLPLPREAE